MKRKSTSIFVAASVGLLAMLSPRVVPQALQSHDEQVRSQVSVANAPASGGSTWVSTFDNSVNIVVTGKDITPDADGDSFSINTDGVYTATFSYTFRDCLPEQLPCGGTDLLGITVNADRTAPFGENLLTGLFQNSSEKVLCSASATTIATANCSASAILHAGDVVRPVVVDIGHQGFPERISRFIITRVN